jgi:hypothetical protein
MPNRLLTFRAAKRWASPTTRDARNAEGGQDVSRSDVLRLGLAAPVPPACPSARAQPDRRHTALAAGGDSRACAQGHRWMQT